MSAGNQTYKKPHRDYRKKLMFDDIDRLGELKEDWDSYGALPITEEARSAAKNFVSQFIAVPINHGGVGFEVRAGHVEISVDFMPDGTVESVYTAWERDLG